MERRALADRHNILLGLWADPEGGKVYDEALRGPQRRSTNGKWNEWKQREKKIDTVLHDLG